MESALFDYEKLILTAYGSIDTAIEQMDNAVIRRAMASFTGTTTSLEQSEQILLIIERKNRLIDLKCIIDRVFDRMSPEELDLFAYKFYKKTMPKNFDYTSRTYFRKQIKAISHFSELLQYIGLNKEKFFKNYGDIPFIKSLKIRCTKQLSKKDCEFAKEIYC